MIDENHNKFMNGGATQGYVTKDNNMKIWPKIDLFYLETSFKNLNISILEWFKSKKDIFASSDFAK